MKVLVYGSRGWIGKQFVEILQRSKVVFNCGTARVDNTEDLKKEITSVNPTHIVSLIGRTHGKIGEKIYSTIDYLEQPTKLTENVRDNLFSPLTLAMFCKERNIHLTYLGTGCIFKYDSIHEFGKEKDGFTEESKPNFFGSSYSVVKGFTDRLMKLFDNDVLNLRIRMPITGKPNPRNFITKITTYEKICSIPNSMTVLPHLLPYVVDMMKKKTTGTINLTNPGLISHNQILEMYKQIVDPLFVWKNFTIEEQNVILASERSNNYLDTTKLSTLYPDVKNIKDSVRDILHEYKKASVRNCLFVTGGAGFIGSNFINMFAKKHPDFRIINFDALYYCSNKNNIDKSIRDSDRYIFINQNLKNYEALKAIFTSNRITHVIHFAAQSHVQRSFVDALEYTNDNIVGTHHLLEICRLHCPTLVKLIHVSTDEVYGQSMLDSDEKQKHEQSVLCPTNPYAATKASAELIAQSYCHSFKMPIIITRGNNVYGKNQYHEKVIPLFIKQLTSDKKITIQGDGSCLRTFLHVDDVTNAFDIILLHGKVGEIYNIGANQDMEYSVMELAKYLIRTIKHTVQYDEWIEYIKDRPFNDQRYFISSEKLKKLGWSINVSFDKGIQMLLNED